MIADRFDDAKAIEELAWPAYQYGRDLLNVVESVWELAEKAGRLPDSPERESNNRLLVQLGKAMDFILQNCHAVTSLAAAVEKARSSRGSAQNGDGWPALLAYEANELEVNIRNAQRWVGSLLVAERTSPWSFANAMAAAIYDISFIEDLQASILRFAEFQPVRIRLLKEAYSAHVTSQPVTLDVPESIAIEESPHHPPVVEIRHCEPKQEKATEVDNPKGRAAYVLELRRSNVPWKKMPDEVELAGYPRASKSKLQKEMNRHCAETCQEVPVGKPGRPRDTPSPQ